MVHPALPTIAPLTVVGLRSAAQNARLGAQARAAGFGFIGLPALSLRAAADPVRAGAALAAALACPVCLFTSPAAVAFADRLQPLAGYAGRALAVGSGTAAALQRVAVARIEQPQLGMHSEGLLALAALSPPPAMVGLVTAPGGRGVLAPTLQARGATVLRADVYQRRCGRLDRRHAAALLAAGPLVVLLSSAEALDCALRQLPAPASARLLAGRAIASSERLARLAGDHGFAQVSVAASPRWPDLLARLREHAKPEAIR